MQTTLNFDPPSPINTDRLGGQNLRLYNHLMQGNSIHCFHPDKNKLRIGYLNSRCSDLKNKHSIPIKKERIKVKDIEGNEVDVIQYSLSKN